MYKTEVRCPVLHDLGQKLQDVLMHENLVYKALPSLTAHSLQSASLGKSVEEASLQRNGEPSVDSQWKSSSRNLPRLNQWQ